MQIPNILPIVGLGDNRISTEQTFDGVHRTYHANDDLAIPSSRRKLAPLPGHRVMYYDFPGWVVGLVSGYFALIVALTFYLVRPALTFKIDSYDALLIMACHYQGLRSLLSNPVTLMW